MPVLAHRSIDKLVQSAFQPRHYKALLNMSRRSGSFLETIHRYLTGKGTYPCRLPVRTPLGEIRPTLYSFYDLLTLNEVFFREDYEAGADDRVIVDVGSNIGLSALYFLTRRPESVCYLFEPDPRNVGRLKENTAAFAARCVINEKAVADLDGPARFGLDVNSGRYGGLTADFGRFTTVQCVHINGVLNAVLAEKGFIDILKIDTEGTEVRTLNAIAPETLRRIGKIYCEAAPGEAFRPEGFRQEQYGTVCRYVNNIKAGQ